MSSVTTKNRINRMTKAQCEQWADDHKKDPTTGKAISAPDSISPLSLNYLISSVCLKHGIRRENNDAVYAILDGKNTVTSVTPSSTRVQSATRPLSTKGIQNRDIIMSLLDPESSNDETIKQQKDVNAKKFIALFKLLNHRDIRNLQFFGDYEDEDDLEWQIFDNKDDKFNKRLKYWSTIMIKENQYYTENNNQYYNYNRINKKLMNEIDEDNFDNVTVRTKSLNKFTNYHLYFKTLFVLIIYEGKYLKHKVFRDDEIFMKFKKLVESVVKKFVPDKIKLKINERTYTANLSDMFRFFDPSRYFAAKNQPLYDILRRYNIYYRKNLEYDEILDEYDSIDNLSINSDSGYSSLEKSVEAKCMRDLYNIQHDMFKRFKDKITKAYYKYNNIERYIDLQQFKSYVDKNGDKIPSSAIASFIDKYEGNKKYENETELYLLKLSKAFLKDNLEDKMSNITKMIENGKKRLFYNKGYKERFEIVIDTESYLSSLFEIYYEIRVYGINILELPKIYWNVIFETNGERQIGIDAGGPFNQLITEVSKELFSKEIFINPKLSSGLVSDKYFLNPDFDIYTFKVFQEPKYKDLDKQILKNEFYYFLGNYINFVLLNNFKLPYRLSSYLLSGFINKNFINDNGINILNTKDEEFTYYMMRDFPEFDNYFIKIMKQYAGEKDYQTWITNDSHMPLTKYYQDESKTPSEVPIEGMNLYINDLAKLIYLKNPSKDFATKDDEVRTKDMTPYHILFFSAIPSDTTKIINSYKITIEDIDDILTTPEIDNYIIKKFVDNVFSNIKIDNDNSPSVEEMRTLEMFRKEANKQKFIKKLLDDKTLYYKLLSFWSGKEHYEIHTPYVININKNQRMLPTSSSCFSTITITAYTDFDTFLEKLEMAVLGSLGRFDLAGGAKQNKKQIQRRTTKK